MKEKGMEIKSLHIKYVFTEDGKKEIAVAMASKIPGKEATEDQKKRLPANSLMRSINWMPKSK